MTIANTKKELVEAMNRIKEMQAQLAGIQQILARAFDKFCELERPPT